MSEHRPDDFISTPYRRESDHEQYPFVRVGVLFHDRDEYVQAYDPDHGVYRLIEVKTGDFKGEQECLFDGIDEVDPLEGKGVKQPQRYDPLVGFR